MSGRKITNPIYRTVGLSEEINEHNFFIHTSQKYQ
jgi:hypothetical protein